MTTKQLHDLAAKVLQNNGNNIDMALPEFVRTVQAASLLDDLARFFLEYPSMLRERDEEDEDEDARD
jgi:hypothetical protein